MTQSIFEFLRDIPAFHELDDSVLRRVVEGITIEFFPKGSLILQQNGPASEYLMIIKKGGVKVSMKASDGEEIVIDYRGEGDVFGMLSLVSGDKSRANVVAVEDTSCYLIGREAVLKLAETYPGFSEYFFRSFLVKYIDKTYREMHNKSLLYGGGDKLLFTTPVGELATRNVVSSPGDITIRDAAEIMAKNRISSLVLLEPDGAPAGIVTDRDLRDKVVSRGRSVTDPVANIMSGTLIKANADDFCFEALLKMVRFNIHHMLVVDDGKLVGIITNHDLMMLQGTSPISVAREIEGQQTISGLVPTSIKINKIVALLLKEGAKASNITRIISEINDRLVRRIIEITEKEMGRPPVEYCWISFGSEGRKEQTFKTDQDNAIIYADPATEGEAEDARRYFSSLAERIRDGLLQCGFPRCPADYMASNPKWCQPLSTWKGYFSRWIHQPTPEAILFSLIFFDFRAIHGDIRLGEELRTYLDRILREQNVFFAKMASVITGNRPPLGFLKSFVVEKSGDHKNELNLKLRGIGPLVDVVRFFALEKAVPETSTIDRIRALRDLHPVVIETGEELEHAFEFITLLRIHHQIEQIERSVPPDNFINPSNLSSLEKKTLKESFQVILKAQEAIIETHRAGMVNQ